jgi:outer membrane protein assembly factor BamB
MSHQRGWEMRTVERTSRVSRYYNGVRVLRHTICCSLAVALTWISSSPARAQSPSSTQKSSSTAAQPPLLYFPLVNVYSVPLVAVPATPPAFDADTAYVSMTNGQVTAIALADGKPRWTIDGQAKGSLACGNGLVFVPGDGSVEARATSDGAVKWRTPTGGLVTGPLVWDEGWLIVATDQHEVIAMRAADGSIVWRAPIAAASMTARPALAAEHLYVPLDDGRVIAFMLESGKPVWERKLGGPAADVLALDDRLFVGSKDNYFYCLETATGRQRWRWRTGADVIGTPTVDRSQVFFVSLDNVLRSLARKNGVLQWQQLLPLRPPTGPMLVDDMLLISGVSVSIRGFLAKEGRPVGEYGAPADLAAPPHYVLKVPGAKSAPLVILLLIDDSGTARLEALTSELPVI